MVSRMLRWPLAVAVATAILVTSAPVPARGQLTREEVEKAIQDGIRYLKGQQRGDGHWDDADVKTPDGTTALVTLALLTAGVPTDDPAIVKALDYLDNQTARDLGKTYSVALQTMVFAQADPARYRVQLVNNVAWLEAAQIKPGDRNPWPGTWTYDADKGTQGDNSNTQYALLGLHAASEVGIPVKPEVWVLSRQYWEGTQRRGGVDHGAWAYFPSDGRPATASMTCAGISSLIITGLKRYQGLEVLVGDQIRHCGEGGINPEVQRGIDWLSANFRVSENYGSGALWKYYYLYGLERTGRLTGRRFFGAHDWYREGAEHLVHPPRGERDELQGKWEGTSSAERSPLVATSFTLLFLSKGRSPVLINKLRHGPGNDWNNDQDDVRNLVGLVSRDWGHLLTWQVAEPGSSSVEDLLQAPILFFNGHEAPEFSEQARQHLREFVDQGGFIFAEACCGREEFDAGFRELMRKVFPPAEGYSLEPLSDDHAVWRSRHKLSPAVHPLWGIEHGCRTVVIYSPGDLSCYWNQMETQPDNPAVIKASYVGQNVIDYATGRELPPDKLAVREVTHFERETPKRGALHIAKLQHTGEWNLAPMAVPNLTTFLREALRFDVVINHRTISTARDPNLVYYPLVYMHGRAAASFAPEDVDALRRHLEPGGGVLFADAACGSPAFDAAFRKLCAAMFPDNPLEPIPPDDEMFTEQCGFDLSDVEYTRAAGGGQGPPRLEGIKINGHWAVIYSPLDIGCALERKGGGGDCKGYTHESALKLASNIVIYSTLP